MRVEHGRLRLEVDSDLDVEDRVTALGAIAALGGESRQCKTKGIGAVLLDYR